MALHTSISTSKILMWLIIFIFVPSVVKVVDHLPVLRGRETPTIAIITALYCEKLAVDAMMEHKVSYVKYKTEGMYFL